MRGWGGETGRSEFQKRLVVSSENLEEAFAGFPDSQARRPSQRDRQK